jgi:diacylglycerol kinase (ATP)
VRVLFVVNERSGRKRDFDIGDVIRRSCGEWSFEIVYCGTKEQLDVIVDRAEEERVDVVYAVGGDGTVHETARRLINRSPALGVLPIGSGNGFARHVGLPLDPAASLASCRAGRIETIDTAAVNDVPFLGVMGIGFDAVVAERFASSSVRGLETYVVEGFRAFSAFRAEEYELTIGEKVMRRKAFVVAIANSGQYGNEARVAPLASLQDGLLDLVIVDDVSILGAPMLIARLFSGSFHKATGVTSLQTPALTLRRAQAGPAHLDGEPVTLPAELRVEIVPRSLRLLLPDTTHAI